MKNFAPVDFLYENNSDSDDESHGDLNDVLKNSQMYDNSDCKPTNDKIRDEDNREIYWERFCRLLNIVDVLCCKKY